MKKVIKTITILSLAAAGFTTLQAGEKSGEELFKANCTSCHVTTHPADESKLVAPPIMGAVRHVKMKHDSKEAAVTFIVDYVQNPTREKAACESHSIKKFGLMPSLSRVLSVPRISKRSLSTFMIRTPTVREKAKGNIRVKTVRPMASMPRVMDKAKAMVRAWVRVAGKVTVWGRAKVMAEAWVADKGWDNKLNS